MTTSVPRVALVSGAGKGLGRAIVAGLAARGLHVVVTARRLDRAREVAADLVERGGSARALALDVDDAASVKAAVADVLAVERRLDVLVNNAAVLLPGDDAPLSVSPETLVATLVTNVAGPLRLTQAVVPGMVRARYGRVVNVSSTWGSLTDTADPSASCDDLEAPAYRASKAALNLLTLMLARQTRGTGVLVNALCPGWVRTDMGGPQAPLTPEQGADTALWLATLPDDGPTGGFFAERRPIPW